MTTANGQDIELPVYKAKDFTSDQEVRWCPGCGDYAILTGVRKALAKHGIKRENYVFVSGIGCAARFPYYLETYGMHTIHGRSLAVATGVRLANPDLKVCVVSGDGDLLSIGGNHTLHTMRRNVDMTILLLNNRIYGLTKGQYSPTSETGKVTASTPMGSPDAPLNPLAMAVACGCTFVARTIDIDLKLFDAVYARAMIHKGTALVEIYQDCNIFNHQAFFYASQKETRPENTVLLEHGKPLIFGTDRDRGVVLRNGRLEKVRLGEDGITEADLLIHDETNLTMAFMLTQMIHPEMPEPMGVLYADPSKPTYDQIVQDQMDEAASRADQPDIAALIRGDETWEVVQD